MTGMDAVRVYFADPGTRPLALTGTVALGWHAGRLAPVADAAALVWLHNGARGLWLTRAQTAPAVHLNGRDIRRIAWLRCGDVIHIGASELRLLGSPPPVPDDVPDGVSDAIQDALREDARVLLRGVGGSDHGRAFTLERPLLVGRGDHADIRIDDPAFAERHARLERWQDTVLLRDLGSSDGSEVNGHPVRAARLGNGDQIVFATHARFVLETPVTLHRLPVQAATATPPDAAPPSPANASHLVWLLLAAATLAAGLVLLLLYGAGNG